jgi:prepilin-type N-terminal cleavage/methylation domain-containing protein
MRDNRRQAGFTLIELLVVILIIGILAGLIVTAVGTVRQRALIAKAKSNIESLKAALAAYNNATGVYPQRGANPTDDPEALFRALYTGQPKLGGGRDNYLEDWPIENLGRWAGPNPSKDAVWQQPSEDELNFTSNFSPVVFLDPWGRPYHYVQWYSFPEDQRRLGSFKAKGGAPFAIWSDGPNRENEWGQGDDVNSWSEKGSR